MTDTLNRSELMRYLRVGDIAVAQWQASGFLASSEETKLEVRYRVEIIDEVLALNAHNFDEPPTIATLQSGELELLLLQEVLDYLAREPSISTTREALLNRVEKDGVIAAIRLGTHWRFSKASVTAYKAAYLRSRELHIARTDAAHILGVSKRTLIAQVIDTGRVAILDENDVSVQWRGSRPLLRDSFMELLRELLPTWITPEEWIALRHSGGRKNLLTTREAERLLGYDHHGNLLGELLEEEDELRYIRTPGGEAGQQRTLITYESVMAHIHRWPILSDQQLSRVFATSVAGLRNWRATGRLNCVLHPAHRLVLRKPCIIGILREWLTGQISGRTWYYSRIDDDAPPAFTEETAAMRLGWTVADVRASAEDGRLKGLHLPNGTWRFSPEQIKDSRNRA